MGSEFNVPILRLRAGAMKDCKDLRILSRTLDVAELFIESPPEERESLTTFSKYEHQEHDLFVEQHQLISEKEDGKYWQQVSRWVKYEEGMEKAGDRWGKAHIPALNFHSLVNLRRLMEAGLILLDLDVPDMESLASAITDTMKEIDMLGPSDLVILKKTLLLKHRHVEEEDSERAWSHLEKEMNREVEGSAVEMGMLGGSTESVKGIGKLSGVIRRIPEATEVALVLVGCDDNLKGLAVSFVRLAEGILMPGIAEIPIDVRFVFVLLGPSSCQTINYIEIGRCMGVLFATSIFRHIIYDCRERREILVALNEFLDASIVIPHGDWDYQMFHVAELDNRTLGIYDRKLVRSLELETLEGDIGEQEYEEEQSPFKRTGRPFGGAWNDLARRYPKYWSDIRDGLNMQCFSTMIFIYFACVSGGIALGALIGKSTKGYVGISESLFGTSVAGGIYALLSCQPLVILATTGGTLVFEDSLFKFCSSMGLEKEFLAFRFWVAVWMFLICLVVVAAEGSVLARYFTRFTTEIFAVFLSVLFIWESVKLAKNEFLHLVTLKNKTLDLSGEYFIDLGLMMFTFAIAWTLRAFKDSTFGTKLLRQVLGNFCVVIAIILVSVFAYFVTPHDPAKTLQLPDAIKHGLRTTRLDNSSLYARPTGWLVNPAVLPVGWILGAAIPGMFLFILIFLEVSIGELIMSRPESLMRKGSGFHADILLICFINGLMGALGTNYVSSATVRSVTHLIALAVYSTNNPPGEKPHILGTREQRLTTFGTSVLLGCSVLMGQVLQFVPMSVLFGVFMYMGLAALKGVQFTDRVVLFFKSVDQYPEVPYVKQVRTGKMHIYTLIQIVSLSIIWGIKFTPGALVLPLSFILLIPLRKFLLVRFFSNAELEALDGAGTGLRVKREPLVIDVTPFSDPMPAESGSEHSSSSTSKNPEKK